MSLAERKSRMFHLALERDRSAMLALLARPRSGQRAQKAYDTFTGPGGRQAAGRIYQA